MGQKIDHSMDVIQVSWIKPGIVRKNNYSVQNIPLGGWNDAMRDLYQYHSLEEMFDHASGLWVMSDCCAVYYEFEGKTSMVAVSGRCNGNPFLWLLTRQTIILGARAYVHAVDTGKRLQEPLEWISQLEDYPQWQEWVKGDRPVYPGGRDKPVLLPFYVRLWNRFAPKLRGEPL